MDYSDYLLFYCAQFWGAFFFLCFLDSLAAQPQRYALKIRFCLAGSLFSVAVLRLLEVLW